MESPRRLQPCWLLPPHQDRSSQKDLSGAREVLREKKGLRHQTIQPWAIWFEKGEDEEHALTLQIYTQHWDGSTWSDQCYGNLEALGSNSGMRWYNICYSNVVIQDLELSGGCRKVKLRRMKNIYLYAEWAVEVEAIVFLQFAYLFSITLMELVGLFFACSFPLVCFLSEKIQPWHALINFQHENDKKLQTLGMVLKVRVTLQRNPRIRTSALWSRQLLSSMVLVLEQFGMTWPWANLS